MYLQYIHESIMYGHLHKINQILIEKLGSLHKKIKTTLFPGRFAKLKSRAN